MAATKHDFKTPVGRLVSGSVYDPQTQDQDGNPLLDRNKQPRVDYNFGIAIPKTPGHTHWSTEAWGAPIWANGHAAWPQGQGSSRDFSWKIHDGDDQTPNKRGRKNVDREGWAGHWVIFFSGGFAPGLFNKDGSQRLVQADAIKRGYWIQVFGNYASNESTQSPGIYMNHSLVALAGYDTEIISGPDAASVGFGEGTTLPAHVSATPVAGSFTPAPPPAAAAPAPSAPPPAAPAPAAPPPVAVTPNPAVLAPPPPASPVAAGPVMTAKAGGFTYEQMISSGWTDAQLRENGYLA